MVVKSEEITDIDRSAVPYGVLKRLSDRFAPNLVLFPEYGAEGEGEHDFHPRDIRLVLAGMAPSPEAGDGWPLEKVIRSFPPYIFVIFALISGGFALPLVWTGFAIPDMPTGSTTNVLRIGWLGVVFALLGGLNVVAMHTVLRSFRWLPIWWAVVFPILYLFPVLAFAAIGVTTTTQDVSTALVGVIVFEVLGAVVATAELRHLYDISAPNELISELSSNADGRATSLRFLGAGAPSDVKGHRENYVRLLRKWGESFGRTGYANVTFGAALGGPDHAGYEAYQDMVAIQYWLAYYYDDWENEHEMDWEQVTVYAWMPPCSTLTQRIEGAVPIACGFSAHQGGIIASWDPEKMEMEWDGYHPVTYVARGSHANYPQPGKHHPTLSFAGLRFGGREAKVIRGKSRYDFTDITPTRSAGRTGKVITLPSGGGPWRHMCDDPEFPGDKCTPKAAAPEETKGKTFGYRWGSSSESDSPEKHDDDLPLWFGLLLFVPAAWPFLALVYFGRWFHQVDHVPEPQDAAAICPNNFGWLNWQGSWGYAGSYLGADGSPESPPKQSGWKPFDWLSQAEVAPATRGGVSIVLTGQDLAAKAWRLSEPRSSSPQ